MFSFGKRETFYRGFLRATVSSCMMVRRELGSRPDAISIAAFLAAFVHSSSLNGGVSAQEAKPLAEHMRQAALETFGDNNTVSLVWSTSFAAALAIWNAPEVEDRALEFYRSRAKTLEWDVGEHRYYHFALTALAAVRASIQKDYPHWVAE